MMAGCAIRHGVIAAHLRGYCDAANEEDNDELEQGQLAPGSATQHPDREEQDEIADDGVQDGAPGSGHDPGGSGRGLTRSNRDGKMKDPGAGRLQLYPHERRCPDDRERIGHSAAAKAGGRRFRDDALCAKAGDEPVTDEEREPIIVDRRRSAFG